MIGGETCLLGQPAWYHTLLYVLPACLYILFMHKIVIINSSHSLASLQCQFVLHTMRSTSLLFYFIAFVLVRQCALLLVLRYMISSVVCFMKSINLNKPRQGIIKMEVDIRLSLISFPCCFAEQDICSAIYNNQLLAALIYFLPTYTLDKEGRDDVLSNLLIRS
jgi:hypothetical protein